MMRYRKHKERKGWYTRDGTHDIMPELGGEAWEEFLKYVREGGTVGEPEYTEEDKRNSLQIELDLLDEEKDISLFEYEGLLYHIDIPMILASISRGKAEQVWKSLSKEEDGVTNILRVFTKNDFKLFSDKMYDEYEMNWSIVEAKKQELKDIYNDPLKTVDDIRNHKYRGD